MHVLTESSRYENWKDGEEEKRVHRVVGTPKIRLNSGSVPFSKMSPACVAADEYSTHVIPRVRTPFNDVLSR